jgi:hypothetical protein
MRQTWEFIRVSERGTEPPRPELVVGTGTETPNSQATEDVVTPNPKSGSSFLLAGTEPAFRRPVPVAEAVTAAATRGTKPIAVPATNRSFVPPEIEEPIYGDSGNRSESRFTVTANCTNPSWRVSITGRVDAA